jgi:hypothetical protein
VLASKTEANDKYSDDLKSTKGELNKAITKGNELAKEIEELKRQLSKSQEHTMQLVTNLQQARPHCPW